MGRDRDQRFTMIGTGIFDWEEFQSCSTQARYLWFAIYASPDSKAGGVPGMIRASVRSLAESAHVPPDEVLSSLNELVEAGLVEHDQQRRIIRFTKLPNACDRATSGFVVKGWWAKFLTFPECPIRDSHVAVLHSLAEHGNDHVRQFWDETFASIVVPVKRHRGRQKFDSDTGSDRQPSLFGSSPALGAVADRQTSSALPQGKGLETLSDRVGISTGIGSQSSVSGEGEQIPGSAPDGARLRLGTVPLVGLPFSVGDMLAAIAKDSAGRFAPSPFDERLTDALCATIRACEQSQVGLDDLRAVGRWLASGGLGFRDDLGPVWVAKPGNLLDAVARAKAWLAAGSPAVGAGRRLESRRVEPAPASAFGSGRRRL